MDNLFKVSVRNWDKFNERADRGNYQWFRFENGFFFDQAVFRLTESATLTFIFFLCEASKRNGGEFEMLLDYVALLRRKKPEQIAKDIEELKSASLISCEFLREAGNDGDVLPTEQNRTEQTEQTEQNNIPHSVRFDFEAIYKKYPRKLGKQKGIARAKAQIKTEADYQALSAAVDRYAAYCQKQGTEAQYIRHFDTFMSSWRDWLEPETGGTQLTVVKTPEQLKREKEQRELEASLEVKF